MGLVYPRLLTLGVEALAIVSSKLDHARLYYRYHPTRILLAADPEMTVLRAFSVPKPPVAPAMLEQFRTTRVDPDGELVAPVPITEIAMTLNQRDGYELTATDWEELKQQWRWDRATQLMARYLIDREGIVRWIDIEGAGQGMAGIGRLATDDELFAAVRAL
jgi:hypothetical protein